MQNISCFKGLLELTPYPVLIFDNKGFVSANSKAKTLKPQVTEQIKELLMSPNGNKVSPLQKASNGEFLELPLRIEEEDHLIHLGPTECQGHQDTVALILLPHKKPLEQEILDNLKEAVCIHDSKGQLFYANASFERLMGLPKVESVQEFQKNLFNEPSWNDPTRRVEEGLSEYEEYDRETTLPSGKRTWLRITSTPMEFGGKRRVLTSLRDISDLKEAELYFKEVFEAAQEGMAIVDIEGRVHEANPALYRMFGYTPDEVLASGFTRNRFTPPEEIPRDIERIQELLSTGKPQRYEKHFLRKDGTKMPVIIAFSKLTRGRGWDTDRLIHTITDLSELKKTQAKLQELIEAQQHTINELQTPAIQVWKGTLLAPLLGTYDSQRMQDLTETVLNAVSNQKSSAVLLDLTGLSWVDTQIISQIVGLIRALRLLGSKAILVGIGPQAAQSLVRLGASLENVPTYATLEQGLRSVIRPSMAPVGP